MEAHFHINIHQNIDNYIAKYIDHPTQQVVLFILHQLATLFIHINIYNKTYIIKQGGASAFSGMILGATLATILPPSSHHVFGGLL
jgi:hypothetical protein